MRSRRTGSRDPERDGKSSRGKPRSAAATAVVQPPPSAMALTESDKRHQHAPSFTIRTALALLLYRIVIAFTLRTGESPDEWWQSAEVAYHMVFGKGHLTWEWKEGIRSATFPLLYAVPFKVLKLLHCDTAHTILAAERLVQSCIAVGIDLAILTVATRIDRAIALDASEAAAGDTTAAESGRNDHSAGDDSELSVCVRDGRARPVADSGTADVSAGRAGKASGHPRHWIVDSKICGGFSSPSVAATAMRLSMLHWYLAYDGARAYSNVAEGLLVMLALIEERYLVFLMIAGIACMVRVTAAVALFPIFLYRVHSEVRHRGVHRGLAFCFTALLLIGVPVLGAIVGIDYLFYDRIILTPWRFVQFNIIKNVSQHYGVYPFWWYFGIGLPAMVGPHMAFLGLLPFILRRLRTDEGDALDCCNNPNSSVDNRHRGRSSTTNTRYRRTRDIVCRLSLLLVWTVTVHSGVAHKEVRFMFPVLPIILVLVSFVIASFVRQPQRMRFVPLRGRRGVWYPIKASHVLCLNSSFLAVNVAVFVILGYVYRQGGIGTMAAIRNAPQPHFRQVDIVTHCYFTPGYSHVHGKVDRLRLIDCPMELDAETQKPVATEDVLYRQHPIEFVWWMYQRRLPDTDADQQRGLVSNATRATEDFQTWLRRLQELMPEEELPTIVMPDAMVVFSFISDSCRESLLEPNGYVLQKRIFHAPKSMEDAEDSHVDLWVRVKTS